jgi:uncharacterized protein YecE (DUF72 family)
MAQAGAYAVRVCRQGESLPHAHEAPAGSRRAARATLPTRIGARSGSRSILYQLPPGFERDVDRLARFLAALPPSVQHVFEFRHRSWYSDATFRCLERHGAALCLHDMAGSAITEPLVGPFVYVRLHGANGRYHGSYTDDALQAWGRRIDAASRSKKDVYVYFNNDPGATSVRNAMTLRSVMDR